MANNENLKKAKGFDKLPENINKDGRPVGTRNRSTIVKQWLEATQKHKNPITDIVELLTQADIMTLAQINTARKGGAAGVAAYKELMDSCFGKNVDKTDITTGGEKLIPDIDYSKLSNEALKEIINAAKELPEAE